MTSPSSTSTDTGDKKLFPEWERMDQVDSMTPRELDALPFGAIQLDARGKILRYNQAEGKISGRDPERMVGRDFFEDFLKPRPPGESRFLTEGPNIAAI